MTQGQFSALMSNGGTATLTTYSAAFTTSAQNIADSALLRASTTLSGGLGLSADGATPLHFWTNDTERMRIVSDGNVGIGTDDPGYELQVYGYGGSNAY